MVLQAAVMLLSTCGQKGPLPPAPTTPPIVTSVTPTDGALNVPVTINNGIVITFSNEMDASTINNKTITLCYNGEQGTVPLSVTYSDANGKYTAVLMPSVVLNPSTLYTVTVANTVLDTTGIAMSAAFTSSFITGLTMPLRVIDVQPEDRSQNVGTTTAISIMFSQPVDPSTISSDTIILSTPTGNVPGNVYYNAATASATFEPLSPLSSNSIYIVNVTTGVQTESGTPMTDSFVASFVTGAGPDTTAPMVMSALTIPSTTASAADVNTPISVTFSEPMLLTGLTPSSIIVSNGKAGIPGTIMYVDNTVIFMPSTSLAPSTLYTVSIPEAVSDLSLNSLSSEYTWSFTTEPEASDSVPPAVLSTFPTGSAVNVPIYNDVVALCSEAVLTSSITPTTTFTLVDGNGTSIPGWVTSSGATLVFTPTQPLAYSTNYVAEITSHATNLAGNPLVSNTSGGYAWSFTTEAIATFIITASTAGGNGSITPSGAVMLVSGATQTFSITPNAGYQIADVLVDGVSVGAVASYAFTNVTANHTISASFSIITNTITATVSSGSGSISPSGSMTVNYGASQTFTFTPATGYSVAGVLADGVSVGAVTSYTFNNVTTSHTISVSFSIDAFTVTSSVTGSNGTISPSTAQTVTYNATTAFTVTPSTGYTTVMGGTCGGTLNGTTYTTNVITANCTVVASFSINANTITALVSSGNGTISPGGSVGVNYGASQTFTFTPATGYSVSGVLVDGVSVGAVSSYTFTNVIANHTISVNFAINTFTVTPSAGSNGSISPSTAQIVNYGSSVTFTIQPNTGYYLSNLSVDGSPATLATSYTFSNVSANHTIAASFQSLTYTITPTAGAGGTIAPSSQMLVTYGGSQTFTISPATGYSIAGVLVDGVSVGAVTSYTFTNVTANHTIIASFSINTFTVMPSVSGSNGTISPSTGQTVSYNSTVAFTVTPATGYTASVGGTCGGMLNGTTYTTNAITANCTVVASFSINTNTITATVSSGSGSISPSGSVAVNYGASQTFTITPATGYSVASVLVDGQSAGAVTSYTFTDVIANHTISASFSINTFTVTPSVSGSNGTISPSTAQTVNYNTTMAFTVTPATGYTAVMGGTCGGTLNGTTYTTNAITANCTVVASFSLNTNTITATVSGGNGTISPSGSVAVNYGGSQTFTITPATGYSVASVLVDGVSAGAVTSYTFTDVIENHTISASFSIKTFTVTPSVSGSNGTISPSTAQTVTYNTTTAFTVTPTTGYTASVGGTCGGTLNGSTYTTNAITADCTVVASFSINTNTITATVSSGSGSISPSGSVAVNYGASQTFTITPSTGYSVASVLVDGVSAGAVTSYTFTDVIENHTISASFSIKTFTVTPSVVGSNGTISPSTAQTVDYNSTTAFTITPATGYTGTVSGTCGGTLSGKKYTTNAIVANCSVVASFSIDTYTITASVSSGNGTISPSGSVPVNYGASQTFTITPASGYSIAGVLADGVSVGAVTSYTFTDVTENHTISASFSINTYTVSPSTDGNGTISPSTPQPVTYGNTTQFTITPNAGYSIASVSGTCGGTLSGDTYTTNEILANCTVVANFSINTYTVSPSTDGNGTISPNTPQGVTYDNTTQFTVTPNTGYTASVGGTCGGTLNGTTYTTSAITADCSVVANFTINTYTVTPSTNGAGTISPSTPQPVTYDNTIQFTVTPTTGSTPTMTGTCGGSLDITGTIYTTLPITTDCTVIADF